MVLSEVFIVTVRKQRKCEVEEEEIKPIEEFDLESQLTIDDRKFWFIKMTTGASAGDHMLQIANGKVSCDGRMFTDTTEFNLYYGHDGITPVCVIHCASGSYKGNLIQIKDNGDISFCLPASGIVFHEDEEINIDDIGDDVLFEYTSDSFQFRLRKHKSRVLGFTDAGKADSTYRYGSLHTMFQMQEVMTI